jgi:DHA1 family multidrug resistance protein-like MFS transporter
MASSWERNRWVIIFSFVVEMIAFMMVRPFVPLYVQELGVTDPSRAALWSGAILAVAPILVALMLPVWDRMAERTGRKFQVLRALLGCILGLSAAAFAQSALQLFGAWLLEGLTAGFYPQMWNLVSTGAPAGRVGEAVSLLQSTDLMVQALGPFLGGLLGDVLDPRVPYVLGASLCAIVLVVMWFAYQDPKVEGEAASAEPVRRISMNEITRIPGLFPLVAMAFLVVSLVPGIYPIVPLYLQSLVEAGAPVGTLTGLALAAGNVAGALAAAAVGRMTRRRSSKELLVASFVVGGLATALVPAFPAVEAALALWIVRSIFTGGIIALLYGVADSHLPPPIAKGAYANLTGAMIFGNAGGPLFAGALGAVDLRGAFIVVGVALMLLGVWAARAFQSGHEQLERTN